MVTDCPGRQAAAIELARTRRNLGMFSNVVAIVAPLLAYATGSWETAWFALAGTDWPLAVRVLLFLVGFHLALSLLLAPLSYYGFTLSKAYGLSQQTPRAWLVDWIKALLLTVVFSSAVGGLFLYLTSNLGAHWWWTFALAMSLAVLAITFIAPYVLVPIFFKLEPLADGDTSRRIHELADRAGTRIAQVCSLDFSRRTAEANAAVIGIGSSRQVVLADTLLNEFEPAEVDAVVAHELGHHYNRDMGSLLVISVAVTWLGLFVAWLLAPLALPVLSLPNLAYVPGYPVIVAVSSLFGVLVEPVTSALSRALEARADRFALKVTRDPVAFAGAMSRLACQNLVEMEPPTWATLFQSHPAIGRRIAFAQSWRG